MLCGRFSYHLEGKAPQKKRKPMASYQTISFEIKDDIAVIRLNRPERRNALNTQMRAEITDAIQRAKTGARVLVITGAGDAFCSGQDLSDTADVSEIDLERILRDEYEPMLYAISECPLPVIAAVNGAAAGAGANLALVADVVIATESAYFLQAFSRIGLIPDAGGTYFLPRQVGMARAMGAALFAEPISAVAAAECGMIWEAVPDSDFEYHWMARAAHLAKGPTKTYRYIKQAIRQSAENTFAKQLDLEAELQGKCGKTRDFKEGVLAFLEKRAANFEGR